MKVYLGNVAPQQGVRDSKTSEVKIEALDHGEPAVTTVDLPSHTVASAVKAITDTGGVWNFHSSEAPTWVASDDETLEAVLAEHFGCKRGAPKDVEATHHTAAGPPGIGPGGPLKAKGK